MGTLTFCLSLKKMFQQKWKFFRFNTVEQCHKLHKPVILLDRPLIQKNCPWYSAPLIFRHQLYCTCYCPILSLFGKMYGLNIARGKAGTLWVLQHVCLLSLLSNPTNLYNFGALYIHLNQLAFVGCVSHCNICMQAGHAYFLNTNFWEEILILAYRVCVHYWCLCSRWWLANFVECTSALSTNH